MQLQTIVSLYSPWIKDHSTWLKMQLIELNCFPSGCVAPPTVTIPVTLHFPWGFGELIPPLFPPQVVDSFSKSDRRRAGHFPGNSENIYNGQFPGHPFGDNQ